ncbi:uncharacterized protein LOC111055173 [Nilaparvata lugens]|uniref:uncharacterized protein LOC111055173 n=1 Tax=Nilaparvata lugens TaxID=108931 RepID=UPI00193E69C3|nr:uncharacterized protein LOC111055173 [Nilaparvata lugens]
MEMNNFDTELFIEEVKSRRVIWNMASPDYKNRVLKRTAWQQLVEIFCNEDTTEEEKKNLGNTLQKRWKNLRYHFSKELKKKKTMKSGSGAINHTPYIYFTRLQFLESCVSNKETINNWEDEDTQNTQVEENEADNEDVEIRPADTPATKGKKRKALDPVEQQFTDILNKSILLREQSIDKNEEDEDKLFCLSL